MEKVRWAALITFFALFVLTLSLGIWQINRGYEKKELENIYSLQQSYPIEEITYNLDSEINLYRSVSIKGKFLEDLFYLDNKIHNGKPGVVVMSPFELDDGSALMISRGWVEMADRNNFKRINTPEESLTLVGTLRPSSTGLTLSSNTTLKLEKAFFLIQALDLSEIKSIIGRDLKASVLELSDLSPASFTSIWKPINLSSYRHFGYAFQWFGLSIVILVGVCVYLFRGKRK
ncbi:MAG: hypothetical protein CMK55_03460 [Proteobacteria bacterium]|nr:hypothetical protein [Pseudomonadota bacterium]RZO98520.1 MAG: SURF1 family protein [Gammaproteobacteria bacterium]|tara:strand:- start:502 stop:1197 length:696 start_codon:yes stop_codon:yes gene_type:complete